MSARTLFLGAVGGATAETFIYLTHPPTLAEVGLLWMVVAALFVWALLADPS